VLSVAGSQAVHVFKNAFAGSFLHTGVVSVPSIKDKTYVVPYADIGSIVADNYGTYPSYVVLAAFHTFIEVLINSILPLVSLICIPTPCFKYNAPVEISVPSVSVVLSFKRIFLQVFSAAVSSLHAGLP